MRMKKDLFNLRLKSKLLLFSLFALLAGGVSPAWADAYKCGFESFEGWVGGSYGGITTYGDGWATQGTFNSNNIELSTSYKHGGDVGLYYTAGNNSSNYIITPKLAAGTITLYAKSKNSSSAGNGYKVYLYKCTKEGDVYTPSTTQLQAKYNNNNATVNASFDLSKSEWRQFSYTLDEDCYVAILMGYAAIDDFEASNGLAGAVIPEKAVDITAFTTTTPSVSANSENKYNASFSVTVKNNGLQDIVAADDVTVSLLDASDNVLVTSDAIEISKAEGSKIVTLNYEGTATTDQTVTFKVKDNFSDKTFATTAEVAVTAYGARFAITPNTAQNLGTKNVGAPAMQAYTITNSGNSALSVAVTNATDFSVQKMMKFSNSKSWSDIYLYTWSGEGSTKVEQLGGWPGEKVTNYVGDNEYNQGQYIICIPAGTEKLILHNNSGSQSEDIIMDFTKSGLYIDDSNNGAFFDAGEITISVPAKSGDTDGSFTFKVEMNTSTAGVKSGNIELAFTAINQTNFTLPVNGVVIPAGTEVVDFNDNKLPEGWGNNASNKWSFADGKVYCTAQSTSPAELTTSKLKFEEGDFFVITATSYDNYDNNFIEIAGSENGSDWTAINPVKKFISRSQIPYGSYASLVITDIPTNVKFLKFKGYYVRIDEIAGLKFDANDPRLAITSDAEGNSEIAAGTACDLGWVTSDATATYYIKNAGTGTLTIESITAPADIAAVTAGNTTTVTSGATLALTITMVAENNAGAHSGTITIATDGGNFEIPVSGVIRDASKNYVNFATADAKVPTGWTANSWTVTQGDNGYIYSGASSNNLITTTMTADTGGEKLIISASGNKSDYYNPAELKVYTKTGDADWSDATDLTNNLTSTSTWFTLEVNVPEGNNLIKFEGKNVYIQRIYGLTAVPVAVMTTTAADIAFGMQTEESTEQSFTITNDGDAALEGLSVTLGKTDAAAEYGIRMEKNNVAFTGTSIDPTETVTVYVKQLYDIDNLGSKSDVLTIAATGQTTKTINLTGATRDGSLLYADFNDGSLPSGWQAGANWSIYNYNGTGFARQSSTTEASSLITTPVTVESAAQTLKFKAAMNGSTNIKDLTVKYTTNGGITWNTYDWANYASEWSEGQTVKDKLTGSLQEFVITGITSTTGTAAFDFNGKYLQLDDIQADYALTTAPLMTFTEETNLITGNLHADATATYTLANNGNAPYVATVETTNVTAVITGDGVTFEGTTLTIPTDKTATITVTMAFAAPYGEKTGNLSITSESWVGDIVKSYTATLIDPTDFVEDFAAGKPAGWYAETGSIYSGWVFSDGDARIGAGTNKKIMITEKVEADEYKNKLTFDAKAYSGDEQTLNVYYSSDRQNWAPAETYSLTSESQTFTLPKNNSTLSTGYYYFKFEASDAVIDNVTGLKRIIPAPIHDLYQVGEATQPTTGAPGRSCTASVTGVSLRSNETVTAELWLKKGEKYYPVASRENETMTVDVNKTFTLTGNLPDEEGEYKMWITVKNPSIEGVYFNTPETDFTLTHDPGLTINSFARTCDATVNANNNNEYTATFNVNVTNTGTRDLNADEVSVTLINTLNDESTFTAAWTAANSQTVFLNPGNYTTGAKMAIYRWNDGDTNEQKEWAYFTEISTGFYSAELNGKSKFIICRVNPATAEDALAWDNNVYNQSVDLTTAAGNHFDNNGYTGEGNKTLNLSQSTMSKLAKNVSTTLNVTVTGTLTNGDDASFSFYAREDVHGNRFVENTTYATRSVSVNAAPVIELDETVGTIASTGQNRKVTLNRTFVAGWNTICLPFTIAATDIDEDAKALKFSEYNSSTKELTFSPVTELEANKPYVIYVPDEIKTPFTFTGKTVTAAATSADRATTFNGVTFQGTYAPMAAGSLDGMWGLTAKGKIAKASTTTTMKGFRAYFAGSLAGARVVFMDDFTGISTIAVDGAMTEGVFNLQGQKVENVKKGGLYIINGKKTLVK